VSAAKKLPRKARLADARRQLRPGEVLVEVPEIELRQAIRDALDEELARDESVVFLGEDVAAAGGVLAVARSSRR
jgi:hypothetical protein